LIPFSKELLLEGWGLHVPRTKSSMTLHTKLERRIDRFKQEIMDEIFGKLREAGIDVEAALRKF